MGFLHFMWNFFPHTNFTCQKNPRQASCLTLLVIPAAKVVNATPFFHRAVLRVAVLRVRLSLNVGVSDPVFAELIKRVRLQTAEREFALSGHDQDASRP